MSKTDFIISPTPKSVTVSPSPLLSQLAFNWSAYSEPTSSQWCTNYLGIYLASHFNAQVGLYRSFVQYINSTEKLLNASESIMKNQNLIVISFDVLFKQFIHVSNFSLNCREKNAGNLFNGYFPNNLPHCYHNFHKYFP